MALLAVPLDITAEMSNARSTLVRNIAIAGTILVLSLVGMLFFFQKMVNHPVNNLKVILEKASSGDLTLQNERAGEMSRNMTSVAGAIEQAVGNVQGMTERTEGINTRRLSENAILSKLFVIVKKICS